MEVLMNDEVRSLMQKLGRAIVFQSFGDKNGKKASPEEIKDILVAGQVLTSEAIVNISASVFDSLLQNLFLSGILSDKPGFEELKSGMLAMLQDVTETISKAEEEDFRKTKEVIHGDDNPVV